MQVVRETGTDNHDGFYSSSIEHGQFTDSLSKREGEPIPGSPLAYLFVYDCVWLRGVDLNHRPLGYEFKGKLIPNNLQAHG